MIDRKSFLTRVIRRLMIWCFIVVSLSLFALDLAEATDALTSVCPGVGIQQRAPNFEPGGIILTTFDRSAIWVYNIDRDTRYPLPDTAPCGKNCHLSRDARWITYFNAQSNTVDKMRLDGTERTLLARDATEVQWWSEDTLLIWTPSQEAYLRPENGSDRELLNTLGVVNVQPGGHWALLLEQRGGDFTRVLTNLEMQDVGWAAAEEPVELGIEQRYFSAAAWSPDGEWLAFTAPGIPDPTVGVTGSEIFGIRPGDKQAVQWTDLTSAYGAVRINGHAPGELSWSPDRTRIAFWVIELLGPDPEQNTGNAVIHILDVTTGITSVYCGYSTVEHTPNPPRLVWSPDGTHVAFGGNVPGDDKGYLLLVLDTSTGVFTELSAGIYPALGSPDVIAWGLPAR